RPSSRTDPQHLTAPRTSVRGVQARDVACANRGRTPTTRALPVGGPSAQRGTDRVAADAPEADLHVVDEDDRHELAVAGLQRGVGVDVDLLPPDAVGLAHGPDRATCRVAQVTPLAAEELHAFSHAPS